MVDRENKSPAGIGAVPSTVKKAIPGEKTNPNKIRTPDQHVNKSVKVTPSIVHKANEILNEEINGRKNRSTEEVGKSLRWEPPGPESLLKEWRKSPSRFGDALANTTENRMEAPTQIASQSASIGELLKEEVFPNISLLKPPPVVIPGQTRQINLILINDDLQEAVECILHSTDLLGKPRERIPAEYIHVSPNPVSIPPGGTSDVQIRIKVPFETPPGNYKGLLQIDDMTQEHVILQLSVGSMRP